MDTKLNDLEGPLPKGWHGGMCPVNPDDVVQVVMGNGYVIAGAKADDIRWHWLNHGGRGDVVSYSVLRKFYQGDSIEAQALTGDVQGQKSPEGKQTAPGQNPDELALFDGLVSTYAHQWSSERLADIAKSLIDVIKARREI